MTIMHEAMSDSVPKPIAHGCYESVPDAWFYLSEFRSMVEASPDVAKDAKFVAEFSKTIAELHKRIANHERKFGWPFFVFAGRNPRVYPLSHSWEETFTEGLRRTFDIEEMAQGPDEEWTQLRDALFEKVIPRLLRPLQTDGRNIVPTLIHGDLWHGNVGIDANTRRCVIYDPSPMFAHHEGK
jgi:fructosamine-3-kinase